MRKSVRESRSRISADEYWERTWQPEEEQIPNFFEPEWVAPRYASARPDVHSAVVKYLQRVLGSAKALGPALDVGFGTGLSTRPLHALTHFVVGLDLSHSMLDEAVGAGGAWYVRARAEALPFPDSSFSLLTIGCAYHWCEPDAFLGEAIRVLSPNSHLAIYDNFFFADRPRSTAVFDGLSSEYWAHLPRTPRNPLPEIGSFDDSRFELVASCFLESWVPMTWELLMRYLSTQSGAVAAVESQQRSLSRIESLLLSGLERLVPEGGQEFHFGGPIWVVRPAG